MVNEEHATPDPQALIMEWLKNANQFWKRPEWALHEEPSNVEAQKKETDRVLQEAILSVFKSISTISTAMGEPSALNAAFRGAAVLPDITSNLVQSAMRAFLSFHKQVIEKVGKLGAQTEPYHFDNLDQETLQAWSNIYESEIQRFFKIPQLGLNRYYQERVNQALDKYNIFTTTLAEFLHMLQLPFEKTTKAMHEKIEELTKAGNLPAESREYYNMWVKTLEGHFMTLFKSHEYNEALGNTMASLGEYLGARNSIIQDMLQSFPIPTSKEMDDLYKEVYLLKKKVRELERENGKH